MVCVEVRAGSEDGWASAREVRRRPSVPGARPRSRGSLAGAAPADTPALRSARSIASWRTGLVRARRGTRRRPASPRSTQSVRASSRPRRRQDHRPARIGLPCAVSPGVGRGGRCASVATRSRRRAAGVSPADHGIDVRRHRRGGRRGCSLLCGAATTTATVAAAQCDASCRADDELALLAQPTPDRRTIHATSRVRTAPAPIPACPRSGDCCRRQSTRHRAPPAQRAATSSTGSGRPIANTSRLELLASRRRRAARAVPSSRQRGRLPRRPGRSRIADCPGDRRDDLPKAVGVRRLTCTSTARGFCLASQVTTRATARRSTGLPSAANITFEAESEPCAVPFSMNRAERAQYGHDDRHGLTQLGRIPRAPAAPRESRPPRTRARSSRRSGSRAPSSATTCGDRTAAQHPVLACRTSIPSRESGDLQCGAWRVERPERVDVDRNREHSEMFRRLRGPGGPQSGSHRFRVDPQLQLRLGVQCFSFTTHPHPPIAPQPTVQKRACIRNRG